MKKWIFWSFERGSFQYDVLCALILVSMFAIPPAVFNDRPDYMRIPDSGVEPSEDDDGNPVYTVKVADALNGAAAEVTAREQLQAYLESDESPDVLRVEAVYDTRGALAAYAFWLQ